MTLHVLNNITQTLYLHNNETNAIKTRKVIVLEQCSVICSKTDRLQMAVQSQFCTTTESLLLFEKGKMSLTAVKAF